MRLSRILAFIVSAVLISAIAPGEAEAQTRRKAQTRKEASKAKSGAKKNTGKSAGRASGKPAAPRSSAEAKRMQEAAQKEIMLTKEQLRLNEEKVKTGLADLNRLSDDIATGRTKVADLQKKVNTLAAEIGSLGSQIEKNEADLQRMREEYLKAVKKMRLTRGSKSALAFIFSSDNFNQALRRLRYMKQFSAWKEKQTADIDAKIKQLSSERERLARVREMQSAALSQLSASQRDLEEKHDQQQQLVARLRQNGNALQAHLAAKQNEANRLKEAIATLIAREQAKAEAERVAREKAEAERKAKEKADAERRAREKAEADAKAPSSSTNVPAQPAPARPAPAADVGNVNFAALKGSLPLPVDGGWRVTNAFGRHSMPEMPEVVYDNPGIDAEVQTGSSVKAVCQGKVSGVYKVTGYGNVVIINHGEYYTVYGNLSSVSVAAGSAVKSGQALGTAGADPDDTRRGSVHFEVWKGREKQNPAAWLR